MESEANTAAEVREGTPPTPSKSEEPKAPAESTAMPAEGETKSDRAKGSKKPAKDKYSKTHGKQKQKKKKSTSPAESASDLDSGDSANATSSSSDSDDSASESETSKNKRVAKKRQDPQKSRKKTRAKKQKKPVKTKDSSDSDSDSDSSGSGDSDSSDDEKGQPTRAELAKQIQQLILLQQQQQQQQHHGSSSYQYPPGGHQYNAGLGGSVPPPIYDTGLRSNPPRPRRLGHHPSGRANIGLGGLDPNLLLDGKQQLKDKKKRQKATKLDFKRVDQVWDNTIHNYKLQDTAEGKVDAQYDEFIFHVRRTFDWEGKYKATIVDIKSKLLRECLSDVMGNIKGVSLVEDTPKLDPNMLFLYLEDLRTHLKELKKAKPPKGDKHGRKKEQKRLETKRQHLKVLIKYIDKDYAETKNRYAGSCSGRCPFLVLLCPTNIVCSLNPMLENGLITFDLLWALWKPNTLAFTTTYGSQDEPRVFKVEVAEKHYGLMKGEYYYIEGKV